MDKRCELCDCELITAADVCECEDCGLLACEPCWEGQDCPCWKAKVEDAGGDDG